MNPEREQEDLFMPPKPERASHDLHESVEELLPRLLEYAGDNADLIDEGVGFILPKTTPENRARVTHVREALKAAAKKAVRSAKRRAERAKESVEIPKPKEEPFVVTKFMKEEANLKALRENLPPEHR